MKTEQEATLVREVVGLAAASQVAGVVMETETMAVAEVVEAVVTVPEASGVEKALEAKVRVAEAAADLALAKVVAAAWAARAAEQWVVQMVGCAASVETAAEE